MPLGPTRWIRLWRQVRASADAEDVFADLDCRYAEPARSYHTAQHIIDCLALFDDVKPQVDDPFALELAIWFHDSVYDPRRADNEELSAQLARDAMGAAEGGSALGSRVDELILTTKLHQPSAVADAPWLLDIDLAILGRPAEAFERYENEIRREYAWVPDAEFRAKRAHILENFLRRPEIDLTAYFRARFEDSARRNLQDSVRRLREGWLTT